MTVVKSYFMGAMRRLNPTLVPFLLLTFAIAAAAPSDSDTTSSPPPLPVAIPAVPDSIDMQGLPLDLARNSIDHPTGLSRTAAKLGRLLTGERRCVSIVHIGDSHIQAGFFTDLPRARLQARFGNAGRGLVFPYRALKTNSPLDYRISVTGVWTGQAIIRHDPAAKDSQLPGISGYTAGSSGIAARLTFQSSHPENGFSIVKLFTKYSPDAKFGIGKEGADTFAPELADSSPFPWLRTLALDSPTSSAVISRTGGRFSTEGMVLLTGRPGVLYHTIGVNGARAVDYLSAPLFWEQLPALEPDLVIVSLGVNEAYEPSFDTVAFIKSIDSLRAKILAVAPGCDILFTTPNDHAERIRKPAPPVAVKKKAPKRRRPSTILVYRNNPRGAACRAALVNYCNARELPCWDLWAVMGGSGSVDKWTDKKLAGRDHLHFAPAGYTVLGDLFDRALEKALTIDSSPKPDTEKIEDTEEIEDAVGARRP
jgi:hypothetical protein